MHNQSPGGDRYQFLSTHTSKVESCGGCCTAQKLCSDLSHLGISNPASSAEGVPHFIQRAFSRGPRGVSN